MVDLPVGQKDCLDERLANITDMQENLSGMQTARNLSLKLRGGWYKICGTDALADRTFENGLSNLSCRLPNYN